MMRIKTALALIALSVSIISPLSVNISVSSDGTYIFTLDVCAAAGQSLSANQNMPFLCEYQFETPVLEIEEILKDFYPSINTVLVVFQKEQPPRT
ncbi:MAG: hypothetical protein AB1632_06395 [Nitrospirota bacterium]